MGGVTFLSHTGKKVNGLGPERPGLFETGPTCGGLSLWEFSFPESITQKDSIGKHSPSPRVIAGG